MPSSPQWAKYDIYGVKLSGGVNPVLGGVNDFGMPANIQTLAERTDGGLHPTTVSVSEVKPSVRLTTLAVDDWLRYLYVPGQNFIGVGFQNDDDHTYKYAVCYGYKHKEGASRWSTAVHRSFTLNRGMFTAGDLRLSHRQNATLGINGAITWDGVNDPIVFADNAPLPAWYGGLTAKNRFGMGPIVLGGQTFVAKRDVTLTFGSKAETEGGDDEISDRHVSLEEEVPVITINGIDPGWIAVARVPLTGLAATQANTTIYLRQRLTGNTFWADNQAKHIKIQVAGLIHPDEIFKGGRGASTTGLRMPIYYDGTNDAIKITFDTTIS
jgi:hypothetical protein